MSIQPDFEELLQLLEKHEVRYMIVGGYAVAFHGYPRFTKDIEVFYECSPLNIKRVRSALAEFGFAEEDMPPELFQKSGNIVTFGVAPLQVDLLNEIDGIVFCEAIERVVRGKYGCVEVSFIAREDLLHNKSSTSRTKDKLDVEELT